MRCALDSKAQPAIAKAATHLRTPRELLSCARQRAPFAPLAPLALEFPGMIDHGSVAVASPGSGAE